MLRSRDSPVSNINLPNGTAFTISRFSSVFKLHPLIPMNTFSPKLTSSSISSLVPVNECTTPPFPSQSSLRVRRMSMKSAWAAREWRNKGKECVRAKESWERKWVRWVGAGEKWRRS